MAPAATAQRMLAREGNAPCWVSAIENMRAKAQTWEKAVRTKALARREPYPPAKSESPQSRTAETLQATGANVIGEDTRDEGNTG